MGCYKCNNTTRVGTTDMSCNNCYCDCNICDQQDPCAENCGCEVEVSASCVRYEGPDLANIPALNGDTLETILYNINNIISDNDGEDGEDGQSVDHVSFTSSTGSGQGEAGETDTYTVWGDAIESLSLGTLQVYNGANGANGNDGQGIDHISFTSSTGSGQGESGETDTYTIWADAGETVSLGTFVIYNGLDGTDGSDGNDGFTGINFYAEIEEDADMQLSPDPDSYNFPIPSYNILTYTNTTASNMTLKVEASWDFRVDKDPASPQVQVTNWVDGALIRTVGVVNTVEWESLGDHIVGLNIYTDPFGSGDAITPSTSVEQVLSTPGGLETNTLFRVFSFPVNKSIFKKLTLAPNETISLMFKTKGSGTSIVSKAQFFVQQLPN